MIDFKPIRLEDKSLYESYLCDGKERGCEYSFSNLYLWGQQNATILHGHMVLLSHFKDISLYPYPVGKGNKKKVLDAIIEDAKERNLPLIITGMCRESQKNLEELYPGQFVFQGDQDYDDYVYSIHDLADLKGRKYHRKKNHYNRFVKNYPSYQVQPLTEEYLPQLKQMLDDWYRGKLMHNPKADFDMEQDSLYEALKSYQELGMEGLMLLHEGEILAFTMASRISDDTFDVHFEKAREDVDGAYTAINCEFAKYIREKYPEIEFLNREEDMGYEGLRKAKESYYPHHMVEKCMARWKGNETDKELNKGFLWGEDVKIGQPSEDLIPQMRNLWKEAFGDSDAFLDLFYQKGFHKSRCKVVTIDGKVVSALYWFDGYMKDGPSAPVAYIYAVATLEEFRGQGMCHKLMQDTLHHLKEAGYEGALLVPASEQLYRFYHHMGFETCSSVKEFDCTSQEINISLRPVKKEEYVVLRRAFLPEGGIIQENENMDFLEDLASLYAGEDFLVAIYKKADTYEKEVDSEEENTLHGIELLGNIRKAPGILYALGYKQGHFRAPGEEMPFAMYYGLKENGMIPTYFGLAFD